MYEKKRWITKLGVAFLISFFGVRWAAGPDSSLAVAAGLLTAMVVMLWLELVSRTLGNNNQNFEFRKILIFIAQLLGLAIYLAGLIYVLRPNLFPQKMSYDFIANRAVTMRLVDETLVKVENWEINGLQKEVLFVHPSTSGTTTLVYPIKIPSGAVLLSDLALAPESWPSEGDGVTFLIYLENDSGIHLLYSRYVDPKHHQQDQTWIPVMVDLSGFSGQLVRVIFSVNSGPAGDARFDWSGWANPRIEQPAWTR
ncbi:MAG: hypothetical protein ACYDH1_12320 [Anaerolineaceae bacterium]